MAHFNNRNNNRSQGGRGVQTGNMPKLPEAFNKGELIEGVVFSLVPDRNGGNDYAGAILVDGTIVVPGTFGDSRFVPEFGKEYYCSVMHINGKCTALPVYPRELSRDEWVYDPPQRTCLTAVLVFKMSDERNSSRQPRLVSHHSDGRRVLIESGFEHRVQPGVSTLVSLTEPSNGGNVLYAIPLAMPATKTVQAVHPDRKLDPPVQPADPLKVTVRRFDRQPGIAVVRTVADVRTHDRQVSIYEVLTYGQDGIVTTADSSVQVIRTNAKRIIGSLEGTLRENSPVFQRQNVMAHVDGINEAVRRAVVARSQADGVTAPADANNATTADGNQPKGSGRGGNNRNRRNRRIRNGQNGPDVQGTQNAPNATSGARQASPVINANAQPQAGRDRNQVPKAPVQNATRPQGSATFGDAVGKALAMVREDVPPASPPPVAPVSAVSVVDTSRDSDVIVPDDNVEIVSPEAVLRQASLGKFGNELVGMAKEMQVTVEVLQAAIAKSGLDVVSFSEKPKNLRMHYVREVKKAGKSA